MPRPQPVWGFESRAEVSPAETGEEEEEEDCKRRFRACYQRENAHRERHHWVEDVASRHYRICGRVTNGVVVAFEWVCLLLQLR